MQQRSQCRSNIDCLASAEQVSDGMAIEARGKVNAGGCFSIRFGETAGPGTSHSKVNVGAASKTSRDFSNVIDRLI
jgi:hypothetical protein